MATDWLDLGSLRFHSLGGIPPIVVHQILLCTLKFFDSSE
jgi:hypothetical protein